jgi:hypothetical protein
MKFIMLGIVIGTAIGLTSYLVDLYQRRNRRANLTRHRNQRQGGGPSNASDTGEGYYERDQGDDWGSDGGGGDSGGGDSGGGGGGD